MSDSKGIMIPAGVKETLTIEIADEIATFHFKDGKTTKRWADLEIETNIREGKPANTIYLPRLQKAITKYEGWSKEAIRDYLLNQLNQLNLNIKRNG